MDGTTVNATDGPSPTSYPPTANLNGKSAERGASQSSSNNEEELHRYVTDDAPRAQRLAQKPATDALIVSGTRPLLRP
jgi:hypothetical protein